MKNAETYYVFCIELMDAEDVAEDVAEDIGQFDERDLAPVVHRKDYDDLRDRYEALVEAVAALELGL